MTDEELSTMLTTVLDELDERDTHRCMRYCDLRPLADKLRPKRVYVWTKGGVSSGTHQYWFWDTENQGWGFASGHIGNGEIFADHKPESTDLAELKPERCLGLLPSWSCKR